MTSNTQATGLGRVRRFVVALGPLRVALLVAASVLVIAVPAPGARAIYHGWGLVLSVLLPVLAPLMFMGLLLDALMTRIFASDTEGTVRSRLRAVSWMNLIFAVVLLLRWLPYYAALRV